MNTLLEEFVGEVADIIATSPGFRDASPTVFAVVNPQAGLFSRRDKLERTLRALVKYKRRAGARARHPHRLHIQMTEYSGHARVIAPEGMRRLHGANSPVMLSAGGDGTHRDLLSGLLSLSGRPGEPPGSPGGLAGSNAALPGSPDTRPGSPGGPPGPNAALPGSQDVPPGPPGGRSNTGTPGRPGGRSNIDTPPVFRLPAGTGNDAADAPTMSEAFERLSRVRGSRAETAIETRTADGHVFYAVNIASFGLDAVISGVTNALRHGHLPGNLYTLVADIATVVYVPIFGIPKTGLVWNNGGQTHSASGRFALVALGAGGYRRYGGGKPILPDWRNLCTIRLPSLSRRIRIKKHVYHGTHIHEREVHGDYAKYLEIHCDERLPFQFDGEVVLLGPQSFPVRMYVRPNAWLSLQPSQH